MNTPMKMAKNPVINASITGKGFHYRTCRDYVFILWELEPGGSEAP